MQIDDKMSIQQTDTEQKSVYFSIVKIAAHCASNCLRSYRKRARVEKNLIFFGVFNSSNKSTWNGYFHIAIDFTDARNEFTFVDLTKRNEATV